MGCFSDGDCLITATNQMHIQFKKRSNSAKDSVVQFNSIEIGGIGTLAAISTSDILLPLNINSDSTLFIFNRVNATSPDSILLTYNRQAKVITKECGAFTYFQKLKMKKTNLDSVQIRVFNNFLIKDPASSAITAYALNFQILY